ncbi:unnamed protein product, partial [Prorocentrum cordatum]
AEPPEPTAAAPLPPAAPAPRVPPPAAVLANRPTPLRRRGSMRRHASTPAIGHSAAPPPRDEALEQKPTSLRVEALRSLVAAAALQEEPSEATPAEQQPGSGRRSGRGLESSEAPGQAAARPSSARRAKSVGALDWKVLRDRSAIIRASAHAGC